MSNQETRPQSAYTVGEQVVPLFGSHKGQTGMIIEINWGDSSNEWIYLVKFIHAQLYYFDDELQYPKKRENGHG
jgi:hypothetical protein